uniref:Uncharacterized protein n=1 Tax=Ditylenchus dipsaci TaxID=166011 RepID=A0A915EDC6_9BILA
MAVFNGIDLKWPDLYLLRVIFDLDNSQQELISNVWWKFWWNFNNDAFGSFKPNAGQSSIFGSTQNKRLALSMLRVPLLQRLLLREHLSLVRLLLKSKQPVDSLDLLSLLAPLDLSLVQHKQALLSLLCSAAIQMPFKSLHSRRYLEQLFLAELLSSSTH